MCRVILVSCCLVPRMLIVEVPEEDIILCTNVVVDMRGGVVTWDRFLAKTVGAISMTSDTAFQ